MKTKYTKKQIQESIKYWQKVLESIDSKYAFKIECYDFDSSGIRTDPQFDSRTEDEVTNYAEWVSIERHNCQLELNKLMKSFPAVQATIIDDIGPDNQGVYVEVSSDDLTELKRAYYAISCACIDSEIMKAKKWDINRLNSEVKSLAFDDVLESK